MRSAKAAATPELRQRFAPSSKSSRRSTRSDSSSASMRESASPMKRDARAARSTRSSPGALKARSTRSRSAASGVRQTSIWLLMRSRTPCMRSASRMPLMSLRFRTRTAMSRGSSARSATRSPDAKTASPIWGDASSSERASPSLPARPSAMSDAMSLATASAVRLRRSSALRRVEPKEPQISSGTSSRHLPRSRRKRPVFELLGLTFVYSSAGRRKGPAEFSGAALKNRLKASTSVGEERKLRLSSARSPIFSMRERASRYVLRSAERKR